MTDLGNDARKVPILTFRLATGSDLATIAQIHRLAYSRRHFTALLPESALIDYYGAFLSEDSEICLAAEAGADSSETILGFSVYGSGIPEQVVVFKRRSAKAILLTSLRHPWTAALKVLKAGSARLSSRAPCAPAGFLLLSIAVIRPSSGVGKLLLHETLSAARNRGQETVGLYVNVDNVNAINAYCSLGFRIKELRSGQYYMEARTR